METKGYICMETITQLSSSSSSVSTYCEVDNITTDDSLYEDDGGGTLYFPLMQYCFLRVNSIVWNKI